MNKKSKLILQICNLKTIFYLLLSCLLVSIYLSNCHGVNHNKNNQDIFNFKNVVCQAPQQFLNKIDQTLGIYVDMDLFYQIVSLVFLIFMIILRRISWINLVANIKESKKEIKIYQAQKELFSSIAGLSSQHNELSLAISLASLNNAAAAWGSKHSVFNLPLPPSRHTVSAENVNLNNRRNRYLSGQSLMSLNYTNSACDENLGNPDDNVILTLPRNELARLCRPTEPLTISMPVDLRGRKMKYKRQDIY